MRLSRALAALAFACALTIPAFAERDSGNVPASNLGPPVVQLTNARGGDGFCTAWYVGNNRFLTAGHCVMTEKSPLKVLFQNGRSAKVDIIAFANPMMGMADFAILELPTGQKLIGDSYQPLELDCAAQPTIGDHVRIEGYPADIGFSVIWGRVSRDMAPWGPWSLGVFGVNGDITGGNSGSPVIDDKTGKVIGILVGAEPSNRSLSAAQSIEPICRLLGV